MLDYVVCAISFPVIMSAIDTVNSLVVVKLAKIYEISKFNCSNTEFQYKKKRFLPLRLKMVPTAKKKQKRVK